MSDRAKQDILYYGKRYKGYATNDEERDGYLRKAARLYATSETHKSRLGLMLWWVEGVRDYCTDEAEVEEMRTLLKEEAARHIVEGRY